MKSIYYTGQALAIAIGVFVGVEHNSPAIGIAVMFALQLLVDIRHRENK